MLANAAISARAMKRRCMTWYSAVWFPNPFLLPNILLILNELFSLGGVGIPRAERTWRAKPPLSEVQATIPVQGASAVPMAVNLAVTFVPTVVTAVMITTALNPAMRPYSMAVTPDSSWAKRKRRAFMVAILHLLHDC